VVSGTPPSVTTLGALLNLKMLASGCVVWSRRTFKPMLIQIKVRRRYRCNISRKFSEKPLWSSTKGLTMKPKSITTAILLCAGIAMTSCAPVVSGNSQGGLVVGVYSTGLPANAGEARQVVNAACANYGKIAKLAPSNNSNGVTISYSCVTSPPAPMGMAPDGSMPGRS
jgi:hypothetical protein